MKIVIAAWHLKDFNVGLGRYTRNLIESLGSVDGKNEYEVLMPLESCVFPSRPNVRYRVCRYPIFKRRFWEQAATLLVGKYDLLHLPYDSCLAVKRGKLIVTIHDLKPLLFPNPKKKLNMYGIVKDLLIPHPLEKIDHIITVSECSRKDIMERLGVQPDRITVIPQGVEQGKFVPCSSEPLDHCNAVPYVLSVAGSDPTKNMQSLITAFSMLPDEIRTHHQLILVGDLDKQGELARLLKQTGIERQVVYAGVVSDQQLIRYYQNAALFVFPSLYEGFGLPVLEAMACGCPVVCSNTSSLPEVVGNAAVMVDPLDVSALAEAIRHVLTNSHTHQQLRKAGIERSRQFSWEQTAAQTVELYERVVNV